MTRRTAAFLALMAACGPAAAEDWPRWRGPRGDGTWNAPKLPEAWPAGGLRTVWKQPVGGGYAGVTAADGRVFVLKTGKKVWDDDNRLTPRGRDPHASVVWLNDGDRALALNAVGELVLLRLNPNGYDEQSRTTVLNGRVWGHPAFAGRWMFAKSDGGEGWQNARPHELMCVELVN